ncbi:MAG TPA: tetratricopeptide repeat protein [Vicinamibacterales bacterium]|jgi:Tfp pilus assembly protein PilF
MRVARTLLIVVLLTGFAGGGLAYADARGDARAQVDFGIKAAQADLWREAIFRWQKAVEIDPTYAAAFNDLAIGYEHEGMPDKARQAYEKALKLDADNDYIRQNYEMFKEVHARATGTHP